LRHSSAPSGAVASVSPTIFFLSGTGIHPHLPSFPTRRSSDLAGHRRIQVAHPFQHMVGVEVPTGHVRVVETHLGAMGLQGFGQRDRKSTRLNSSHVSNSYAVFCLKKKGETQLR